MTNSKHNSNADIMTAWQTPAGQLPLDVAARAAMPLITIDTDNAIIRLYVSRAHEAGLSAVAIARLRLDTDALATAVSAVSGADFRVRSEV